ncbi:MAG: 2-oxo acid dehydrogenase subunit E2 [Clostridia bacterium]|nr:2-oxo acid dehydrogenase subunit E2 [Clostridia bacterium]
MANIILMPQKGVSEESAVLAEWYIQVGDTVKIGDKLFSIENGKSAFDEESEVEGTVLALLCEPGDELPIKAPVCVIGAPGESFEVPGAAKAEAPAEEKPAAAAETPAAAAPVAAPAKREGDRIFASPRARNLAEKAGADLTEIGGTGPEGRIIERDVNAWLDAGRPVSKPVEAAAPAPAAAPAAAEGEFTVEPISRMRRIIAENMHKSLSEMAQLTETSSFDASAIMAFRKSAKAAEALGLGGVTLNDVVLFAVSRTLLAHPDLNANFDGDNMKRFNTVHLGFACDTPKGLVVPVIRNAEKLSLLAISAEVKRLAKAAQEGTLSAAEMSGGSFTVSNLGAFGIESFTPVINPPQTGILGVNTISTRVREVNGELKAYPAMALSLTFDHRVVDGAPAARFLKDLGNNLENFSLLLAK